jgi:hypothetical protein
MKHVSNIKFSAHITLLNLILSNLRDNSKWKMKESMHTKEKFGDAVANNCADYSLVNVLNLLV